MLTVYLAALAFGLVLIGASVFHGDGDSHDTGDDHGDGDADHGAFLSNLFSLRFWTYALGAFGMSGTALSLLGVGAPVHVPVSVVLGFVVGTGVATLFRSLGRGAATSPPRPRRSSGRRARSSSRSFPTASGRYVSTSPTRTSSSRPGPGGEPIQIRERVVVVRFRDGIAEVEPAPWKE
jgi:hypothetical protein